MEYTLTVASALEIYICAFSVTISLMHVSWHFGITVYEKFVCRNVKSECLASLTLLFRTLQIESAVSDEILTTEFVTDTFFNVLAPAILKYQVPSTSSLLGEYVQLWQKLLHAVRCV